MYNNDILRERFSVLSDEDLIKIVQINKNDYEQEAIEVAKEELAKRGIKEDREIIKKSNEIIVEDRRKEEIEGNTPLSTGKKIICFVLGLASVIIPIIILYMTIWGFAFISKGFNFKVKDKLRQTNASITYYYGLSTGLIILVLFLRLFNPTKVFSLLEIIPFILLLIVFIISKRINNKFLMPHKNA